MTDKDTITLPREVGELIENLMHHAYNDGVKKLKYRSSHTVEAEEALRTALAAEPTKPEPVAVVGTQSNEIWKRVYENWVRMPLPEPAKKVHLLRDLPLGTPLYTAPPEDEALRRDAERYRWLRNEHSRIDPCIKANAKYRLERDSSTWVNIHDLDAAIDAAMQEDKT